MKIKQSATLTAIAASILMLTACGKQASTTAPAASGASGTAAAATAGGSGDVIRIGFTTDMSGVYSDVDGKAGAA